MKTLKESLIDSFDDQVEDLKKRKQIEEWLKMNNTYITRFTINKDLTIDINAFRYSGYGNFPDYIQFNICKDGFYCEERGMDSLRGCPKRIYGDFNCNGNPLKNLKGGPEWVLYNYDCNDCELKSLDGVPEKVGGYFYCNNNPLTDSELRKGYRKISSEGNFPKI